MKRFTIGINYSLVNGPIYVFVLKWYGAVECNIPISKSWRGQCHVCCTLSIVVDSTLPIGMIAKKKIIEPFG